MTVIIAVAAAAVYVVVGLVLYRRSLVRLGYALERAHGTVEVRSAEDDHLADTGIALLWPLIGSWLLAHSVWTKATQRSKEVGRRRAQVEQARLAELSEQLDQARRNWSDSPAGSTEEAIFAAAATSLSAQMDALGSRRAPARPRTAPSRPSATSRGRKAS